MNFFDWLNPEKAGKEVGRSILANKQKEVDQRKMEIQNQEDATKRYTQDYLNQLEEPYGKAYDKNRENLVNTIGGFNRERTADYGMELGRAGLGNTVAGSLLKNKLANQQGKSLGQTLSGLDATRLQQMAGLKLTAMQMGANKLAGRVADNAARQEQASQEAMAIPNMIAQYLGSQSQQAKQAAGTYLTGGLSSGSTSGFGAGQSLPTGYAYIDGKLTYTGGV